MKDQKHYYFSEARFKIAPRHTAHFLLMGGNFSKTRAPGELVHTTRSYRRSKRGVWTGNSNNTRSCPRNSPARMVISIQRSELLSGHRIKGISPARSSTGTCRCLPRPFPAADGMHAGRVSRRALGRDVERCGSELRWEIVLRDKETSWKPSCKIDRTGNNSASDRLSNFPQRCQEHSTLSR